MIGTDNSNGKGSRADVPDNLIDVVGVYAQAIKGTGSRELGMGFGGEVRRVTAGLFSVMTLSMLYKL